MFIAAEYSSRLFRFCPYNNRLIGQRWKNIDPDRLAKYSEMASEDTERYKNEMQTYNGRQEAKMRSEALKPPVTYPTSGAGGPGRGGEYPGGPQGADARGPGGYPEQMANMSAFANPAAGAAGMGAGGYNPYGGMGMGAYGAAMGMGAYGGYDTGGGGYGAAAMGMGAYGGYEGAGAGYGAAMGMMGGGGFQGGMMGYG